MPAPADIHTFTFIPLGTKGGIMCVNGMVKFDEGVPAAKDDIAKSTMGFYRNEKKFVD